MGILLVKLLVALLQDMIWIADMFLDCHGLEVMQSNQYDNANHPLRKATKNFYLYYTFSLAFSFEGVSIQLNSSSVSTYAAWILLMRSLTCEQMTKIENLSPVLKEKLRKKICRQICFEFTNRSD